uniref:Nuclear pore complex protein n=1 Tax=Panagrellus redivivus TaxID=6233 RepID=A0A7E4ZY00_PANRE
MSAERSFLNDTIGSVADARHNDSTLHQSRLHFGDDNEILLQVCQDLFMDFKTICSDGGTFMDIVGNFRQTSSVGVEIFERTFNGRQRVHPQIANVLESIKCERNTYDLILKLYTADQIAHGEEETRSDLKRLFRQNDEFRRLVTLLHWSEETAFESPVGFSQMVEEVTKLESMEHAFGEAAYKRGFAHPDSVYQGTLSAADAENLDRIKRIFFCLLRCGRVSRMDELVDRAGLSFMKVFIRIREVLTNPDRTPSDNLNQNHEFAEARLHFKNTASMILEVPDDAISPIDQSIWAALSGNLAVLLTHAEAPEDVLWSYLNCAVEAILDDEIVTTHSIENDDIVRAVEEREELPQTVDAAFAGLLNHTNTPYYQIISALAVNSFTDVVALIHGDIKTWDEPDPIKLRLYTHLVLLIKASDSSYDPEKADEVILAYVQLLAQLGMTSLVPFYAAKIQSHSPIEVLTEFLYGLKGEEDRITALKAADEAGFDVGVLCKSVYAKAKREHEIGDDENIADSVAVLMDAWKFLLISPDHTCFEALTECNTLLRKLFARDRLAEAMDLLAIAPSNLSVDANRVIEHIKTEEPSHENALKVRRIMDQQREQNSYLLYLEIMDKFTMWTGRIRKKLPSRAPIISDTEFAKFDLVQRAEYEKKHAAAREQVTEHLKNCNEYKKLAVKQIHDLYNQVSTWLVTYLEGDEIEDLEEHKARVAELKKIREHYLYYTVTMLITLHRESHDDHEVLGVADLITNPRYDLHSHLSRDSLRKIFAEIAKSGHIVAVNDS